MLAMEGSACCFHYVSVYSMYFWLERSNLLYLNTRIRLLFPAYLYNDDPPPLTPGASPHRHEVTGTGMPIQHLLDFADVGTF